MHEVTQHECQPDAPPYVGTYRYGAYRGSMDRVRKGALVATAGGKATLHALGLLEPRGSLFIDPGTECFEGMLVGEHSR